MALPDSFWWVLFLMFLPLVPAVVLVGRLNREVPKPKGSLIAKLLWGVVGLAGAFVFAVGVMMEMHIVPDTKVVDGDWLREADVQFLRDHQLLAEGEEILLFYSTGLSVPEDGQYLTEDRLVSYFELPDSGELYFSEVDYENITGVRTTWSTFWIVDSTVTITTDDDYEFEIWLSPEDEGDRRFVKELKKRANLGGRQDD